MIKGWIKPLIEPLRILQHLLHSFSIYPLIPFWIINTSLKVEDSIDPLRSHLHSTNLRVTDG